MSVRLDLPCPTLVCCVRGIGDVKCHLNGVDGVCWRGILPFTTWFMGISSPLAYLIPDRECGITPGAAAGDENREDVPKYAI